MKFLLIVCLVLLIPCILVAGCSDQPAGRNTSGQLTVSPTATATASAAKYTAGDVVASTTNVDQAWLILSYDAKSDQYQWAAIYQNADGSWGYRTDTATETRGRNVVDKVYSKKLSSVSLSSVPVRTPTTVSTTAIQTTTATTSPTPTGAPAPTIKKTNPDSGISGTTVSSVEITGTYFQTGALVKLTRTGSPAIDGTSVNVVSPTTMTCTFIIPANATSGSWNVMVTNPDGQSYTFRDWFDIHV
jgi:hypothetical protein